MNDIYSLEPPYFIAHRGASAFAPENTLSAFRLAVEHGADAVELDAKLSSDGRVVVIHDQTLNRTAGVEGRVRDFLSAILKLWTLVLFLTIVFQAKRFPHWMKCLRKLAENYLSMLKSPIMKHLTICCLKKLPRL